MPEDKVAGVLPSAGADLDRRLLELRRDQFGDLRTHQNCGWTFAPIKGKRESDHKRVDLPFRRNPKDSLVISRMIAGPLHRFQWGRHRP